MPDINELIENAKANITVIKQERNRSMYPFSIQEKQSILYWQTKLEAYLEVKEWLDAWMSTGGVKYQVRYSRDGEKITPADIVTELAEALDDNNIDKACDILDERFLDGAWGDVLNCLREGEARLLKKDIRGLVIAAYNKGKQTGEVEVTYTPYTPKCIRCDSSEGVRLGAEEEWYHCDRCDTIFRLRN